VFGFFRRNKTGLFSESKALFNIIRISAIFIAGFFVRAAARQFRASLESFLNLFCFFQFGSRNKIMFFGKRKTFVYIINVIAVVFACVFSGAAAGALAL